MSGRVSIIMSVYNAEDYLHECLDSILIQKYKNIEVVIINDGCKDSSGEIIEQFIERCEGAIKVVYEEQENQGLTKSLNRAIVLSTGDYIARCDADDILEPNRIHDSLQYLENEDLDFLTTQAYIFESHKEEKKIIGVFPKVSIKDKYWFDVDFLTLGNPHIHGTFFGKRSVFLKHSYNEVFKKAQDYDFLLRISIDKSIRKGLLKEPLYWLRKNIASSGRSDTSTQITTCVESLNALSLTSNYLIPAAGPIKKFFLRMYKYVRFGVI
ncbi:glycosyltransferase family 2 protein [Cobetia marina]|uniref:glycosyltransferase family 2 protein n=1 Tax=Cobetia marina TaxID=28258 RepID=UPI0009FCA7F2|nr:glycosyltransferase family A protein [Cobetia marina]